MGCGCSCGSSVSRPPGSPLDSSWLRKRPPEQEGSRGCGEAGKRTFCSRKRPSMMLLHRSSSRLRSTMWSRTSSPGLAAERPRRLLLAYVPHPPGPASDTHLPCLSMPLPESLGLVSCATHTKSPTCSLRTVWVTCSRCSWRISSDLCPALESQGRRLRSGQASATPASSPSLPPTLLTPWSRQHPHTTAPCTLQASTPAAAAGHCLHWRHYKGGLVCVRPEPHCQGSFPPNPVEVRQPQLSCR